MLVDQIDRSAGYSDGRKANPSAVVGATATAMWFTPRRKPNAAEPSEDAPSSSSPRSSQPRGNSLRTSSSNPCPKPQSCRDRALASPSSACDVGGGCGDSVGRRGGGGFLSWIFSAGAARADEGKPAGADWDAHGLPITRTPVPLSRLHGRKRYKISEVNFLDRRARDNASSAEKNPLLDDMVSLRPGGVYTRLQLLGQLQAMTSSGMFEQISLQGKPKPDGTLALTVAYAENIWPGAAKRVKCVNVGLMAPPDAGPAEDMTAREKMDYIRRQDHDYRQRIRGAKLGILPESVRDELLGIVKKQGKLTAGVLQRMRDRVEKWYHDEGFVFALVQNFSNLDGDEVVLEVLEGDITRVEYQWQDKLGNIVEGNTHVAVVDRELPQQVYIYMQFSLLHKHLFHG